ncbi:MAG: hypothetical protein NVSMB52_13980 [Chloroflexota bacterium]
MIRQTFVAFAIGVLGVFGLLGSAYGASTRPHQHPVNWNQHDTAVYVVSTLNLLHSKNGRSLTTIYQQRLGVSHFDVYADTATSDLYFIEMKRDDGSVVGVYAYQVGWSKPKLVYIVSDKFGHVKSPLKLIVAYKSDSKSLMASFTSTFPL